VWWDACDFSAECLGAGFDCFAGDFFGSGFVAAGLPLCASFAGTGFAFEGAGGFPWA
jgi:hypothetical protein